MAKHRLGAIRLVRVEFMPQTLEPGVLYVSEKYDSALHLCACGCGTKTSTPLGPAEWNLRETKSGPTLYPSIGNWQQSCKSHYWIYDGKIIWAEQWTSEQIASAANTEDEQRRAYYDEHDRLSEGIVRRIWRRISKLIFG
jgi:Family of unknown function (DUF6527)